MPENPAAPGAVFLSYASQDAEAAKRICEALRAAGVEVWFDQSELVGGDQWDGKIRGQISSCALFVPVISANTQARLEGYFRLEWKLAAQRTHTMADEKTFLLPVLVDGTRDAEAKVPAEFKPVQWTKLPGGETPPAFVARVKQLLSGPDDVARASRPGMAEPPGRETRAAQKFPGWLPRVVAGAVVAAVALLIARPWDRPAPPPPPIAAQPAGPAKPVAPLSEARQLVTRANDILGKGDLTRAQLEAAEVLCEQALKLDATDAEVWIAAARVDLNFIYPYRYDESEERRKRALSRAAKAVNLAPDFYLARGVQAAAFAHAGDSPALRGEAEKIFRDLLGERPDDPVLLIQLAEVLRGEKKLDEAAGLFERAGEPEIAGWSYYQAGKYPAAYEAANRALARKRTVSRLVLKALLEIYGREDLAAAQATIDQLKPSELLGDIAASVAAGLAVKQRDPERVLQIMNALPQDYLSSGGFAGPKVDFTGAAHAAAGRPERARADWQAGLAWAAERVKAEPKNRQGLLWVAKFNARLGEKAEAGRALQSYQLLAGNAPGQVTAENGEVFLLLGRHGEILEWLLKSMNTTTWDWGLQHADLRFLPIFDPLRGDPRFRQLLRDTLPPGAKPLEDDQATDRGLPAAPAPVEAKSVAVLAFANLSDDKSNEYFSDGISEELLNQLGKVAGLRVAGRASAFSFKGQDATESEIAGKLGVAYVVTGSVQKSGSQVRITARLVKAADGFQVWSDKFTRDLKDIFAVQDEIAGLIAQNLQLKLGDAPRVGRVVNPEAYRLVLEGRHFWMQRTEAALARAETAFTKALEIDSQFAQAHAGLADVWAIRGWYRLLGGTLPLAEDFKRAITEANTASQLDPTLAEPHAALGSIYYNLGRFAESNRSFQTALRLNPGYTFAHHWWAHVLVAEGRLEEGLGEFRAALRDDPLAFITLTTACSYLSMAGRYAEALELNDRAMALRPDIFPPTYGERAYILFKLGRREEAVAAARVAGRDVTLQPRWWQDAAAIGVLREAGFEAEAADYAARVQAPLPPDSYLRGYIALALGRKDEALALLVKNTAASSARPALLYSAFFDEVREDPRFAEVIERAGLVTEYRLARAALKQERGK